MALADLCDGFIFDYGGVLVHHQSESDHRRMAETAGIPQEAFSESYWTHRLDYDKGIVTALEYWSAVGLDSDKVLSPETMTRLTRADSTAWMNFDQPMWDWIDELRASGKRVAMLSNMPFDLGETLKTRTKRMTQFDHVTLSYELHSVKPEPEIYEHCLAGLGTEPSRTVFFDDRIANVRGAELLGIHAIEFRDRDEALRKVRS